MPVYIIGVHNGFTLMRPVTMNWEMHRWEK